MSLPFETPRVATNDHTEADVGLSESPSRVVKLSPAEADVLTLAALGKTNQEIAEARGGQMGTVKTQLTAAYKKLGVKNRGQAIFAAIRAGLLTDNVCERADEDECDLGWLLPHAAHHRWPEGRAIFKCGEQSDSIFLIVRGRVKLPELDCVLGAHDIFGETESFADSVPRRYSAICETHVDGFELKMKKARELSICEPGFALHLMKLFVRRMLVSEANFLAQSQVAA